MSLQGLSKKGVILFGVLTALAGCGGGAGGGEAVGAARLVPQAGADSAPTSDGAAVLIGRAAMGTLNGAEIRVQALNADGTPRTTAATTVTAADGAYRAELAANDAGGPLLVSARGGRMQCDTRLGCGNVAYGAWLDADSAFTMSALVPNAEPGQTTVAHVTPFTEMAVARAGAERERGAAMTRALAGAANHEVGALLGGIDVLRVAPVDVTAPAPSPELESNGVGYAALIAGVARLAAERGGQPAAFRNTLDDLARSFRSGQLVNREDPHAPDPAKISLAELAAAANAEVLGNAAFQESLALLNELAGVAARGNPGEWVDPRPDPAADGTAEARARRLLDGLRPWVQQIRALERPAEAYTGKLQAALGLGDDFGDLLDDLGETLAQVGLNLRGEGTDTGALTLNGDAAGIDVRGNATRGAAAALRIMPGLTPNGGDTAAQFSLTGSIASADVRMDFVTPMAVTLARQPSTVAGEPPVLTIARIDLAGAVRISRQTGANPANFLGRLATVITPVRYETALGPAADLLALHLDLQGIVSHGSDSFEVLVRATLRNVETLAARTGITRYEGERPRHRADFGFAVGFDTQLGAATPARITLAGTRTGLARGEIGVRLRQNDVRLRATRASDGAVTFANDLGAELEIAALTNELTGDLRVDGIRMGSLRILNGLPAVQLDDGSVEMLF